MLKALLAAYWAMCFYMTHMPPSQIPSVEVPYVDKAVHFCMYFGLSLLWRANFRRWGWKWILPLVFYAAFDELSQPYFQRDAEWGDFLMDLTGLISAPLLFNWFFWARDNEFQHP